MKNRSHYQFYLVSAEGNAIASGRSAAPVCCCMCCGNTDGGQRCIFTR